MNDAGVGRTSIRPRSRPSSWRYRAWSAVVCSVCRTRNGRDRTSAVTLEPGHALTLRGIRKSILTTRLARFTRSPSRSSCSTRSPATRPGRSARTDCGRLRGLTRNIGAMLLRNARLDDASDPVDLAMSGDRVVGVCDGPVIELDGRPRSAPGSGTPPASISTSRALSQAAIDLSLRSRPSPRPREFLPRPPGDDLVIARGLRDGLWPDILPTVALLDAHTGRVRSSRSAPTCIVHG